MDMKEKLVELKKVLRECLHFNYDEFSCDMSLDVDLTAENLIAHGVTVQEFAYWQYIEDDVDEDNNIQAYCSACGAGDKHATSMIGKVPYCWKCGRKMMPQPPKGE